MMEASGWLRLTLGALATWRLTHLLASEDGPADTIVRIRRRFGKSLAGDLMDCFNCLSLWIAGLIALAITRALMDWLLYCLALSGAACLLERYGREPVATIPEAKESWEEHEHVLWTEESRTQK